MSEVEKMYENAGVEPTHYDACALEDKYWNNEELANQYGTLDRYLSFECPYYGEGCYSTCEYAYDQDEYPPFSAEKQLSLVKWLLQNKRLCIRKAEYSNNFYMDTLFNRLDGVDNKDFEQCLASLVNNLWQDLTEEEHKQVKEILK